MAKRDVGDKVFKDPVHGSIRIPALCVSIIDTPQFQRLRRIQQLGGVSYVYYGATHTRFEHRIGVCYLAGNFLEHLQKEHPELEINGRDILCVQVASLCRDLGSGPLSHIWQKKILKSLNCPTSKHEELSVDMFKRLVKKNNLEGEFIRHLELSDGDLQDELEFIQKLIVGAEIGSGLKVPWTDKKREGGKAFLYNIISNKENEIDVDKWDYLARDCHYLGLKSSFDHLRLMNFASALPVGDSHQEEFRQICYRDKEEAQIYEMFHTRIRLHQKAYQHKTVKAIECMLADAIISAKDSQAFQEEIGCLEQVVKDMAAYEALDDTLISRIRRMKCPDGDTSLEKAKDLIKKIEERRIYQCFQSHPICFTFSKEEATENLEGKKEKMRKRLEEEFAIATGLGRTEFSFELVTYECGKESENPVDQVFFYEKSHPEKAEKTSESKQVSSMFPKTYRETCLLLTYKIVPEENNEAEVEEKIKRIREKFKNYCRTFQSAVSAGK